jgi:putative acetyltransferase
VPGKSPNLGLGFESVATNPDVLRVAARQPAQALKEELSMATHIQYPQALDPRRVGTYPAAVKAGGGFVWDAVLEYRVWCHPERGAPDEAGGSDYFRAFATYPEALAFSEGTEGAEEPIALILQEEYIDEPEPGTYVHIRERRVTEWPVVLLSRPRRAQHTIPDFLSPDAPSNRLDILRGLLK